MKKVSIFLLSFFISFMLIAINPTSNITVKASGYNITMKWDSYGEYVESGTETYFTWSNTPGSDQAYTYAGFHHYSAPLSIYCKDTAGDPGGDQFRLNLTTPIPMNKVSFKYWFEVDGLNDGWDNSNINFYNEYGQSVNHIMFSYRFGGTSGLLSMYDYIGTEVAAIPVYEGEWNTYTFQNNHSSESPINYVYQVATNGTGHIDGLAEVSNQNTTGAFNQNLSYIIFDIDGIAAPGGLEVAFDDITFDSSEIVTEEGVGYCDTTGLISYGTAGDLMLPSDSAYTYLETQMNYEFTGTIKIAELNIGYSQYININGFLQGYDVMDDYKLFINGMPCSYPTYIIPTGNNYKLVWCGLNITVNNKKLLFELATYPTWMKLGNLKWKNLFCFADTPIGTTNQHNDPFSFGDGNLGGEPWTSGSPTVHTLCMAINVWYEEIYNTTTYTEIPPDELNSLRNAYGIASLNYSFIHIVEPSACFYGVGKTPLVKFYFDSVCFNSSNTSNVIDYIICTDAVDYIGGVPYARPSSEGIGKLTFYSNDSVSGTFKPPNFGFPRVDNYYILTYNTTNSGLTRDTFLMKSNYVSVCWSGSGDDDNNQGGTGGTGGADGYGGNGLLYGLAIFIIFTVVGVYLAMHIYSDLASSMVIGVFLMMGIAIPCTLLMFPIWIVVIVGIGIIGVISLRLVWK